MRPVRVQRRNYSEPRRELTRQEYYRLLHAARRKGDLRLFHLLKTICSTGIRVSELLFITVKAVQRGRADICNKGKYRTILLPRRLCEKLLHYCRELGITHGSVFVTRSGKPLNRSNIWAMMKALCRKAQVSARKVFPHKSAASVCPLSTSASRIWNTWTVCWGTAASTQLVFIQEPVGKSISARSKNCALYYNVRESRTKRRPSAEVGWLFCPAKKLYERVKSE